jgi:hypothetical protein
MTKIAGSGSRSGFGSIGRGMNPRIRILTKNVMDPQHCFLTIKLRRLPYIHHRKLGFRFAEIYWKSTMTVVAYRTLLGW